MLLHPLLLRADQQEIEDHENQDERHDLQQGGRASSTGCSRLRVSRCREHGRTFVMRNDWSDRPDWRAFIQRPARHAIARSEEHTSELQSLMRNSYAGFWLKIKNKKKKKLLMKDNIEKPKQKNE